MPDIEVRTGQAPPAHTREQFSERFRARFFDPAFRAEDEAIGRLEEIAWEGYCQARKSPLRRKAGPGFADPDYELSAEWYDTRKKLLAAHTVLVIDVRDQPSYEAGHIPSAISIPGDKIAGQVERLKSETRRIVTYCA